MLLRSSVFVVCQSRNASAKRIESVLIANRGEIALRVMRTARKLNIKSVAIFSDADVNAQHTKFADQAFRIGEPAPIKSYLCADRVIDVALKAGVQAIHPGYGFLSENASFAEKCHEVGIIFIGPPADAIRKMGMKNEAKKIMIAAKVPTIEGYNDSNQDPDYLFEQARKIGFPVMIKAVYGGGGKGMRIAQTEDDFLEALESAKSESNKAFGNSEMILEKFVQRPRHVEVQIFGDTHRNYVYLWERDCSIQRRHQKIIEEAPAPGLSMETRRQIGEAGVNAGRAVGYVGAGTVEFIMDPLTQKFYFMEMNTRLQVEHPISEAITGVDLVEWQFKVAEGGKIPLKQKDIPLNGHALEARVYAEDENFMPTAGRLEYLSFPNSARIDSGVVQGDEVSVFYDPMIAKVIVHGTDRDDAIRKLDVALSNTHIGGLSNNVQFVQRCLNHREFAAGNVSTDFIEENRADLFETDKQKKPSERAILEGACARLLLQAHSQTSTLKGPFGNSSFFRLNHDARIKLNLSDNVELDTVVVREGSKIQSIRIGNNLEAKVSNIVYSLTESTNLPCIQFSIEQNDQQWTVRGVQLQNSFAVFGSENSEWPLALEPPNYNEAAAANTELQSTAPMPGVVEKVFVKVGDVVNAGQTLCTMIAMKMEYVLKAPFKCKIEQVACAEGKNVQKNAVLVRFEKVD